MKRERSENSAPSVTATLKDAPLRGVWTDVFYLFSKTSTATTYANGSSENLVSSETNSSDQNEASQKPFNVVAENVTTSSSENPYAAAILSDDAINTDVSWKEVPWDTAREKAVKERLCEENEILNIELKEKYEKEAAILWERFYLRNKSNFFKERHYLHFEFPELRLASQVENVASNSSLAMESTRSNEDQNPPESNAKEIVPRIEADVRSRIFPIEPSSVNKGKWTRREKLERFAHVQQGISKLEGLKVLEIGCGTGATLFPLMQLHQKTYFYALDFSSRAIDLLKKHALYDPSRCNAFVCDIALDELPSEFLRENSLDYVLMIFMLSAVKPERMPDVLRKVNKILKPGGVVLFRDYGVYDMTQVRFFFKQGRKLGENYYLRADGTTVYYFTIEFLSRLFADSGFNQDNITYDTRELRNRKRKLNMYRVWVNGRFMKRA